MNRNSIDKYHELVKAGIIKGWQQKVYDYVITFPGCTSLDCEKYLEPRNYTTVAARFGELIEMGLIQRIKNCGRDTFRAVAFPTFRPPVRVQTLRQKYDILLKCLISIHKSESPGWVLYDDVKVALKKVGAIC